VCETLPLTLREEHRLRVLQIRVLRKIFGPKREAEEDCIMRSFITCTLRVMKSRKMRWVEHVALTGEMRNIYSILVGKPEGKRQCGRPKRRWEDHIRLYLRDIGWKGVD